MKFLKRISKATSLTSIAFSFLCSLFILQGCSKEDDFGTNAQITKEDVIFLANKYNIPIEFTDEIVLEGKDFPTLEELDKIFAHYKECREKPFERTMVMTKSDSKIYFRTELDDSHIAPVRLKLKSESIDGGMWSEDAWYYDLTWLDADVSWQDTGDALNVNISSSYNGVSLYGYVQDNYTYSTSGDTIYFQITGTQSMTIGLENFGIHFNDDVNASGWVNTTTGEGTLTIDKSDYWF